MKLNRLFLAAAILLVGCTAAYAQSAVSVVAPAGSTAAVPQPDGSVVFLHPFIAALTPYIITGFGAVISGLAAWAVAVLKQRTGIAIAQANLDLFDKAATTQAGAIWAAADAGIANAKIDVGNPLIAGAANLILTRLPQEAAAIGMTPGKVKDMIVGKIGALQASASPPAAATKP
jgi:hypothetical protein